MNLSEITRTHLEEIVNELTPYELQGLSPVKINNIVSDITETLGDYDFSYVFSSSSYACLRVYELVLEQIEEEWFTELCWEQLHQQRDSHERRQNPARWYGCDNDNFYGVN